MRKLVVLIALLIKFSVVENVIPKTSWVRTDNFEFFFIVFMTFQRMLFNYVTLPTYLEAPATTPESDEDGKVYAVKNYEDIDPDEYAVNGKQYKERTTKVKRKAVCYEEN